MLIKHGVDGAAEDTPEGGVRWVNGFVIWALLMLAAVHHDGKQGQLSAVIY